MRKPFIFVFVILLILTFNGCSKNPAASTLPAAPPSTEATVWLSVKPLCQYPDFPTGCEVTAAVMALNYYDDPISVADFIDNYLPTDFTFYRKGLILYGPDPNEVFVGNPRSENSYGCFSPVIKQALDKHLTDNLQVIDTTGYSLNSLCDEYIDNKIPVILWASTDMKPFSKGQSWRFSDGTRFTWSSGEHCLLLVGYSKTDLYFCDPHYSHIVTYPREIVSLRYQELGCQSLVISPIK